VRSATLPAGSMATPTELVDSALRSTGQMELELTLSLESATMVEFSIGNSLGEHTVVRINRERRQLELDRSASGVVNFHADFARLQTAPIAGQSVSLKLHLIVDRSSVELFLNDGEIVMTALVFPRAPYDSVVMRADRPVGIRSGTAYALESIWKDAAAMSTEVDR
jgi:fructan beta-fructosidase